MMLHVKKILKAQNLRAELSQLIQVQTTDFIKQMFAKFANC